MSAPFFPPLNDMLDDQNFDPIFTEEAAVLTPDNT